MSAAQQPHLIAQDDIDELSEGHPHSSGPRHTRALAAGIATVMIVVSVAFLGHKHAMPAEGGGLGGVIVEAASAAANAGRIHWQHHPEYCVVASDEITDSGNRAVVITKCSQSDPAQNDTKKWQFPSGGVGNLRWDQDTSLCLHGGSTEGESVVLWDCGDEDESANMKFAAADGRGVGQVLLSDTSMCIGVKDEKMEEGVKLVMSACAKEGFDGDDDKHPRYYQQMFYLHNECSVNPTGDTKTITWTNWMLPKAEADRDFSCLAGNLEEVTMQNCSGGDAEKFQFPDNCNMGMIKNIEANKCLRVKPSDEGEDPWVKPAESDGSWSFNGVRVDLWDCDDAASSDYMRFIPPYAGGGGSEVYPMGGSKLKGPIRWAKYPWNCIEYSSDESAVQLSGCPEHHPLPAAWAYWFTKVFVIPN